MARATQLPGFSLVFRGLVGLAALGGCNVVESLEKYLERKEQAEAQEQRAEGREARAKGDGFSVPVPEGFTRVADVGHGGLGFVRDDSAQQGRAATSILIAREPLEGVRVPSTGRECEALARNVMASTEKLVSTELVEIEGVERCRYTVEADAKSDTSTSTLMAVGGELWWLSCKRDEGDTTAMPTCDEMLEGWRNDPIAPEVYVLKAKALAERTCACETLDCATTESQRFQGWIADTDGAAAGLGDAQAEEVEGSVRKMTECMTRIATSGI